MDYTIRTTGAPTPLLVRTLEDAAEDGARAARRMRRTVTIQEDGQEVATFHADGTVDLHRTDHLTLSRVARGAMAAHRYHDPLPLPSTEDFDG